MYVIQTPTKTNLSNVKLKTLKSRETLTEHRILEHLIYLRGSRNTKINGKISTIQFQGKRDMVKIPVQVWNPL